MSVPDLKVGDVIYHYWSKDMVDDEPIGWYKAIIEKLPKSSRSRQFTLDFGDAVAVETLKKNAYNPDKRTAKGGDWKLTVGAAPTPKPPTPKPPKEKHSPKPPKEKHSPKPPKEKHSPLIVAKAQEPEPAPIFETNMQWTCNEKNKPYNTCEQIDVSKVKPKKLMDMTIYPSQERCEGGCKRYGSEEFLGYVESGWPNVGESYTCKHDAEPFPNCEPVNFGELTEDQMKNISVYPTREMCEKRCADLFDKNRDTIEDSSNLDIEWLRKNEAMFLFRAINHFELSQHCTKGNLGKDYVTLKLEDIPVQTWVKAGSRIKKYAPQYMSLSLDANKTIQKYALQLDKKEAERKSLRNAVSIDIEKLIVFTEAKGGKVRFPKRSDLDFKVVKGVRQVIVKIHPVDVIIIPIFNNYWLDFVLTGTYNYKKPILDWNVKKKKKLPFDVRTSSGWGARNYALKDQEILVIARDIPTSTLKKESWSTECSV